MAALDTYSSFPIGVPTHVKPSFTSSAPAASRRKRSVKYALEYGSATLEMAEGALPAGSNVLLVDDLLVTGGTARAGEALLSKVGAHEVALATFIEVVVSGGAAAVNAPRVLTILRV